MLSEATSTSSTSRRRFLRQTLLGSLILTSSRTFGVSHTSLAGDEAPGSLEYFSPYEFSIMKSATARIVGLDSESPLSPDDVATRVDKYLSSADPEIQEQFHQLLTVFNAPFFTFLFDWRLSSFVNMSSEDQDSYLEDWMTSNFEFRRTGFQALKRVCVSMYYTDARSWPEIGYEGMFLPWDR